MYSKRGGRGWFSSKGASQGEARAFWPCLFPPSLLQAAWSWPEVSRVVGGVISAGPLPRHPKAGTVGPHSAWASLSISVSLLPTPPLSLFSLSLPSEFTPSPPFLSICLSLTIPFHPIVHPNDDFFWRSGVSPPKSYRIQSPTVYPPLKEMLS